MAITKIKHPDDLFVLKQEALQSPNFCKERIYLCTGGGCIASGAFALRDKLKEELIIQGLNATHTLIETGCLGPCALGPVLVVGKEGIFYQHVLPEHAQQIVSQHLISGQVVQELLCEVEGQLIQKQSDLPFFRHQKKNVLELCGRIDPCNILEYIAMGGYQSGIHSITQLSPEEVIQEVLISGIRGRGGAGFPTGLKWQYAFHSKGKEKYILCNADEGDPGAFMDRSLLEGDPHKIIEGMMIGAYAIGATQAYVYVRAEYPLAIQRLQLAIDQAKEYGLLGNHIVGTHFSFHLEIRKGSGAFVCGEETALITSIEGNRGEPRTRPPFPTQQGLWNQPTVLNNVETFANIPLIMREGGRAFATTGTEKSKGTKIFALAGSVKISGLVEVAVGTSLRDLIFNAGGGVQSNKPFKAAQIGGPSGGCIPEQHLDVPLDYESLNTLGAIMGSGGLIVMDDSSCMVDVARFFMEFVQDESCGKCVPCREGSFRMLEILENICQGKGNPDDLIDLESLAETVGKSSLCGLGQTAPNPVLSTLRHFRHEYIEHITEKKCRTAVCKALITFEITQNCTGCAACKSPCPTHAISGIPKEKFHIDTNLCTRCGLCLSTCKFDAIIKY